MIWISIIEVGCVVMFITAVILAIIHDVRHWRKKDEYDGVIDGRDSDHGHGIKKPVASGDVTEGQGDSDASGV